MEITVAGTRPTRRAPKEHRGERSLTTPRVLKELAPKHVAR